MEIKKSEHVQLEDKRLTFFLLGLLLAFSVLFVGLQYHSSSAEPDDTADLFEDLSQELALSTPQDQKDMVSAEAAAAAPPTKSITDEVKAAEKVEQAPQKMAPTTSELVVGDGQGEVKGADVQEVAPEQPLDNTNPDAISEAPLKFTVVQKIPEFPGGWSAFMQWLTKNLKYPAEAQSSKVQGKVIVSFIVNKDGSVADVKVATSAHPLLDSEALRVLKTMPKWKPGMDHNKVCRTMIAVPVVFKL